MNKITKAKFFVVGAVIITVVLLFVAFFLFSCSSNRRIETNTKMYLTENSQTVAALFNTMLEDQLVMLESQVRYFNEIDMSDYNEMKDIILSTKGIGAFKTIGVANSSGSTVNYNGKSSGNILLTDYFRAAMNGENAISEIVYVDEDGDNVLVLAVPIVQNGKPVGVVFGTFTKSILDSLVDSLSFAETGENLLIDDTDGTVLAQSANSSYNGQRIGNLGEINGTIPDPDNPDIFFYLDGADRMIGVKSAIGLHDWSFVTLLPESLITDLSSRIALSVVFVIATVGFSVLLLFASITYLYRQLKGVSAEKDRMSAELDVAAKIQADMLPYNFPERKELALYATMTPAKEIGGDFYDFFFIDDDHLVLVMADVSGKGMPAAMFMVNAKAVLRNVAMAGHTVSDIMHIANNVICENNRAGLFVTVWLGILTISTGELRCSNAGHEYPAIKRAGGEFGLALGENCPPLAAMEDLDFDEETFFLKAGDALFLYTDGVPEAKAPDGARFGTDKMLNILNSDTSVDLIGTLSEMKKEIDAFNGDKDPFDDVTMMGLKYYGSK